MALRTVRDWKKFFGTELKFEQDIAEKYANVMFDNGYCDQSIDHLLRHSPPGVPPPSLLSLDIKAGHCLKMSMYFVQDQSTETVTSHQMSRTNVPRPVLTCNMNQTDFDQFHFEWSAYSRHYIIKESDIPSELLYCGNEDVRKKIRIEKSDFLTPGKYTETELFDFLKSILLSKVSRIVHVKQFYDIRQKSNEPCDNFLSRLQAKASCCLFQCLSCGASSVKQRVKEQFIVGLENESIHRAIIKTESTHPGTPLDQLVLEAEMIEQSARDQETMKRYPDKLFSLDNSANSTKESDDEVNAMSRTFNANKSEKKNGVLGVEALITVPTIGN